MPLAYRFSRYVGGRTANGCILWTGCTDNHGYGNINDERAGKKRPYKAHRVAWELANGPIPDGLCVLHRCDTPLCVNVEHLFLGTRADNVADMISKGRNLVGVAMKNTSKLNPEAVRFIRASTDRSRGWYLRLAAQFGVTPPVIYAVIHGTTWKHVT